MGGTNPLVGSRVQYTGDSYTFGWFSSGSDPTLVSNTGGTPGSGTITTIWTAGSLSIMQTTTYTDGNEFFDVTWRMTNNSVAALTDLRFFHGGDVRYSGSGWWRAEDNSVGSTDTGGRQVWLQGLTPPAHYDSLLYLTVRTNGDNGLLTDQVDATSMDSGIALQWNAASLSPSASWTVAMREYFTFRPTTTTLSSSPNPSTPGQDVTFTATVAPTSGSGTPTGSVNFYEGETLLGSGPLNASGVATYVTSSLAAGEHTIKAIYGGDTVFDDSTSADLTHTVQDATTTTALVSAPNPSTVGQSVTFTATVTAASGTPTGSVTFYDDGDSLGSGTLNAGVATYTTSSLAAGEHIIKAIYGGAAGFDASTSPNLTHIVHTVKVATTTTLVSAPNPSTYRHFVTITATVTAVSGTPTGSVGFYDGVLLLGTEPLNGSGMATYTTSSLAVGENTLKAHYYGDTGFDASTSGNRTHTVVAAAPTDTDLSVTESVVRDFFTITYTIQVNNLGPLAANGALLTTRFAEYLTNVTWTCSATGGAAPCNNGSGYTLREILSTFPANASVTYVVTANIGLLEVGNNMVTIMPPHTDNAAITDPDMTNNVDGYMMYHILFPWVRKSAAP
jgi:uncharacterized repeat protein (TIGR01451 family)